MTINTVFEQVKNLFAPEVKVEQSVPLADGADRWFALIEDLIDTFNLELLEEDGQSCLFKYPGSPVVHLSQLKVVWGATPDEAPYHRLQAYLRVERTTDGQMHLSFYENLMGSPAEHRVYRNVLQQRMEKLVSHLRSGQITPQ
ncbi:hypothetical protein [Flavilitoribacter nigricans]|uniref:Uncharacterized protein n=1 Tax=Flavilitoribacter nigricans (strain ATCC 23147 / DSM 23189 / NBRC 102662 / NCIMB 1420 / SS-2) TaxID=1122177 RepID=A0A2D0N8J3_FLAN2|nr:hypothetical protein [Flavilitoribacter nigricans]PHN04834.1 hypothetical protein CRP01_20200 [Flavilitoribacter nigricans DSM 23189 = NBRC 102662]